MSHSKRSHAVGSPIRPLNGPPFLRPSLVHYLQASLCLPLIKKTTSRRFVSWEKILSFTLAIFFSLIICVSSSSGIIDPVTTTSCHVRAYRLHIVKKPYITPEGEVITCQAMVSVDSCWGRCESHEIGDYLPPWRLSHHPVCSYRALRRRRVPLPHCRGHPEPYADVFDATDCVCRMCDSDYTSCEDLNG